MFNLQLWGPFWQGGRFALTGLPTMLCGSECWALNKADIQRTDALDRCVPMKNPGHSLARLCQKCRRPSHYQPAPLSSIIKSRRLTFFEHLARMDENADASQAIFEPPPENWRRPPGRPRTTWMKNIHDDRSSLDRGIHEARDRAEI